MFEPNPSNILRIPHENPPQLIVTIDTEAEFDWGKPHSRSNNRVDSVLEQYRAQEIFDRHEVVPTYLVDYAVVSNEAAVETLRAFEESGRCEIGTHLNPWLNPPFEETVNALHSYPCNLPDGLERRKLERLTLMIEQRFGTRPTVYRAGRYGIGSGTSQILEDLGYRVDMSVSPFADFTDDGGPSFRDFGYEPFRFGTAMQLLEVPLTCGFSGWLAGHGKSILRIASSPSGLFLRLRGVLARFHALERIRLTPEGTSLADLCRITESLLNQGCRVFSFAYHSPSLSPGKTPYVRDQNEVEEFLRVIESYLTRFKRVYGGEFSTALRLHSKHCTFR